MPLMTGSNWIQLRCISDNFRLRQLNEVTKKDRAVTASLLSWPPGAVLRCLSVYGPLLWSKTGHVCQWCTDHNTEKQWPQAHADILLTSYKVDKHLLTKPRWPRKTYQTDWRLLCWWAIRQIFQLLRIFVKLREREGQRVDSRSRLSIVNCRLSIIDIDFPEALH